MKKTTGLALGSVFASMLLAGCSTTNTYVDYNQKGLYSGSVAGNVPFVEVGQKTVTARGFVWESCSDITSRVAGQLNAAAHAQGANRVIDIQWLNHADGDYVAQPICTTAWGWFAAAGVGGLGPWVKMVEARGNMVFADDAPLNALRSEHAHRLAERDRLAEEARQAELLRRQQEAEAKAEAERQAREQAEAAEQADDDVVSDDNSAE